MILMTNDVAEKSLRGEGVGRDEVRGHLGYAMYISRRPVPLFDAPNAECVRSLRRVHPLESTDCLSTSIPSHMSQALRM